MQSLFNVQPIILASKSPRRKYILEQAGISVSIVSSDADETFPEDIEINAVPEYIARIKAMAVMNNPIFKQHENSAILAADTIVVLRERVIGKPSGREEAISILSNLSGQTHEVITGVYIHFGNNHITFHDRTLVTFHSLTSEQIKYYVDHYKPYDKAGAYAIQEWIGIMGIEKIDGDFYNVMGLPISRVVKKLQELGLITYKEK